MDTMYKQFNIDGSTYIFCVEDFEILKISENGKKESILQEIKNKKAKSEKNIDELQKYESGYAKSTNINTIGVNLVNGCNLNCTYCYISASSKKRENLSERKFIDILNFLKKEKDNPVTFYFAGSGEPTLNFKLMKQLPKLCKENGFKKITFDLTTNGTILTKEMIEFLKINKFDINISLDGNEEIHDLSRVYNNGKGSFKDVYHNITLLQENNIKFLCTTVLVPCNNKIIDVFNFFEEKKIYSFFAIATNSFDDNYIPSIKCLDNFKNQMNLVVEKYVELIRSNNTIYSLKIKNDIERIHYGDTKAVACVGAREGIYIDMDGSIFPCSYHSKSKELSVGYIYVGIDYDKIIENKWYAQPVDNYETCRDCWMKYLCSGSCFAIKWLENNNTETPSEYLCKTYDIYWSAIIKLYILIYPDIIEGKNVNFKDINDGK